MKIGHPADKPLPAPAAGTPAAPAEAAAKATAGVRATRRCERRRQRDGRPVEHRVDPALRRRLGRVRRRQGRPHLRRHRRRHLQGQPRSDRRQADRQRPGAPRQGAGLMAAPEARRRPFARSSKRACRRSRRAWPRSATRCARAIRVGIDLHAAELHRALASAVTQFSDAAKSGPLPPALRHRLASASGQVAAQRESLARATAALDRAIDVLLPRRQRAPLYSASAAPSAACSRAA